jgi:hypothetical protein
MPEAEKPVRTTRKDITEAIKAGCQVAIGRDVYRKGLGGKVTPPLPAPPPGADPDQPGELEAVIVRDEFGRLTQAGAEHAIQHGGAVLLGDEAHTTVETLPDLEAYHDQVARNAAEALDQRIAEMHAMKTNAQKPAFARQEGKARVRLGGKPVEERETTPQGAGEGAASEGAAPEPASSPPPEQATPAEPAQPASEEESTRSWRRRRTAQGEAAPPPT